MEYRPRFGNGATWIITILVRRPFERFPRPVELERERERESEREREEERESERGAEIFQTAFLPKW